MAAAKMHADEVATDADLVRRLLAGQFPTWADLPIIPVPSAGTDNALYRLGDDLVVRMPRLGVRPRLGAVAGGGGGCRVTGRRAPGWRPSAQ